MTEKSQLQYLAWSWSSGKRTEMAKRLHESCIVIVAVMRETRMVNQARMFMTTMPLQEGIKSTAVVLLKPEIYHNDVWQSRDEPQETPVHQCLYWIAQKF